MSTDIAGELAEQVCAAGSCVGKPGCTERQTSQILCSCLFKQRAAEIPYAKRFMVQQQHNNTKSLILKSGQTNYLFCIASFISNVQTML